jgi:hypothetical protein
LYLVLALLVSSPFITFASVLQPCATGAVDGPQERSQNFSKVIDTVFQGSLPVISSQAAGPAYQMPPVMFTPEVDPNYVSSGSHFVASQSPTITESPTGSTETSSTSDESLAAAIHNPITIPDTPVALEDTFTQDQADDAQLSPDENADASHDIQLSPDENTDASHDIQIPKSIEMYSCSDNVNPRVNSVPIDIPFEYEVFVSNRDKANDTMQELKRKIMQDIGLVIGCSLSPSKRRLRQMSEMRAILGFQLAIDSNDLTYEACNTAIDNPQPTCISAESYLTIFFDSNASGIDIEESKDSILSLIADGMHNGNYASENLIQVHFVGDPKEMSQSDDNTHISDPIPAQSSEAAALDETPAETAPVWIPIFITLLILIIAAANIAFIRRYKRDNSSAKVVPSIPKSLAAFVSNLEGVPTPKMDSNYSESSESIDESQLDCFDELNGPPFGKSDESVSSVSDYFSRESASMNDLADSSEDRIVLYVASEHSSQSDADMKEESE